MRSVKKKDFIRFALVSVVTSLMVTASSYMGYFEPIQRKALDLMVWWKEKERPSQIVIVALDDEAFQYLGDRQPLPRKQLASLITLMKQCGAKVIGLDVELKARTDRAADDLIEKAVQDRTVITYDLSPTGNEGQFTSQKLFVSGQGIRKGFANTYIDSDGLIRKAPLMLRDEKGDAMPSFALAVAGLFQERLINENVFRAAPVRINYAGAAGTFPLFPATPLFQMAEKNIVPTSDNPFNNKIVLIGATFRAGRDIHLTPSGMMSGVELQANIIHTLLQQKEIRPFNWVAGFILQVSLSMLVGLLFLLLRPLWAIMLSLFGIFFLFVPLSYLAYTRGNYWVDFVLPVIAVALTALVNDNMKRRAIRHAFGQYVSNDIVEGIYHDESALRGRKKTVTVLFSDIRGFTTISESQDLESLAGLLNEFFEAMTEVIFRNRGMINKFIGDAIMAIYGAPVDNPDHAVCAVRTALGMQKELEALNRRWTEQGIPPLQIGVGIHTGEVFAGNIGSGKRKEYTVIGDAVNLASRIEGLNKEFGTTILVSEDTYVSVRDLAEARDLGMAVVKGRHKQVRVFELTGMKNEEANV